MQVFTPLSSATLINCVPYCRLCLAACYLKKCPATPLKPNPVLIRKYVVNLTSMLIRPRWYQANVYIGCSPTKKATLIMNMQRWINVLNSSIPFDNYTSRQTNLWKMSWRPAINKNLHQIDERTETLLRTAIHPMKWHIPDAQHLIMFPSSAKRWHRKHSNQYRRTEQSSHGSGNTGPINASVQTLRDDCRVRKRSAWRGFVTLKAYIEST